jgi:ParB family transcriptional regulator, chromosome partitioning protein
MTNSPTDHQRKALGRGLSALLPSRAATAIAPAPTGVSEGPIDGRLEIPIDQVEPNPLQPRTIFQSERLEELAQSIRANGVIQPLVVRRNGPLYQLVAGERRWRAAKLAGLNHIPVVVQDIPEDRLLEITLIENIQREDLNPIEVAVAFDRLVQDLHLNHEEIARRTGKDRTTITNMLRLLKLPGEVQQLLAERRLHMGHARAILALPTPELQRQVADKASAEQLSVRQVERLVNKMNEPREPKTPDEVVQDPNVKAAAAELERILGTRVRIVEKSEHQGRIEIEYYSALELDRIYSTIVGTEKTL